MAGPNPFPGMSTAAQAMAMVHIRAQQPQGEISILDKFEFCCLNLRKQLVCRALESCIDLHALNPFLALLNLSLLKFLLFN